MNGAQYRQWYRDTRGQYDFFDVNCWLPQGGQDAPHAGLLPEELQEILAQHGIGRAVVSTRRGYEAAPLLANVELARCIAGLPGLYAAGTISPEAQYEPGGAQAYIDSLIGRGFVLLRSFPRKLNHTLDSWNMGELLQAMQRRLLPLMLWHTEADFSCIDALCRQYPRLPVILEGNDKKLLYHNRTYIPLLAARENLYIETHNFVQYLGYEYVVNELGCERLLFGSYLCSNDPGASIAALLLAGIPESAKRRIASGNLDGLISAIGR